MPKASLYERQLIEAAFASRDPPPPQGMALVLSPHLAELRNVRDAAIWSALSSCGFRRLKGPAAFDSASWLADVVRWLEGAQIIVADLTGRNPDILYAVGLAHGLGRCPLLIAQDPDELPFQLQQLRCIRYRDNVDGWWDLREELSRAVRVFLTSSEASQNPRD